MNCVRPVQALLSSICVFRVYVSRPCTLSEPNSGRYIFLLTAIHFGVLALLCKSESNTSVFCTLLLCAIEDLQHPECCLEDVS